jgi:hypothetical protein
MPVSSLVTLLFKKGICIRAADSVNVLLRVEQ